MNRFVSRSVASLWVAVLLLAPTDTVRTQELDHLQTNWVSSHPAWFTGYRFTSDDHRSPDQSVTSGSRLPNYLVHVASSFDPNASAPVEIRFDVSQGQNAYRICRTPLPAGPYLIQPTDFWTPVPFSVWDVSNPATPRQLTVAWRDQNLDGVWNPTMGTDNGELVYIYHKSYEPTGTGQFSLPPGAIPDETTMGAKADIMYGLSIRILDGHSLNESAGILTITPSLYMPVTIAIKPGSDGGSINCQNPKELIPVAILTTPAFDASLVDPASVRFGWNRAPEIHGTAHVEDVDGDGDNDLLFHFRYVQTGIMCEETEAVLFGFLKSGMPLRGRDSIHFITPGPTFKGATGIHEGNDVVLPVSPDGELSIAGAVSAQGFYPKKTQNGYIYHAGPWVGGVVNGVATVAETQHMSEFVPSQIGSTGVPFRVFNSSLVTDRKNWPPEFSTAAGDPVIVPKAQNLVTEYNDVGGQPRREVHTPLGIQIRQRSLAYGDAAKRSALIILWEIQNISTVVIQDAYFGFWADPDIGDAGDDRTSTYNGMALTWDTDFNEPTFTEKPSVFAFDFLETPGNLGVRNYTAFTNGGPNSDAQLDSRQYQFLSGALHFETQWRGDVRSLLSTGPFTLAPGGRALVAGAMLFARIPLAAEWLMTDAAYPFRPLPGQSQLAALLQLQSEVRSFYDMTLKGEGLPKQGMQGGETAGAGALTRFKLCQNHPNPFNPLTTIRYQIPVTTHVSLKLFDLLGREVATLVDGVEEAGVRSVQFDGTGLSSGVYIYRMTAGTYSDTKRLLLVR